MAGPAVCRGEATTDPARQVTGRKAGQDMMVTKAHLAAAAMAVAVFGLAGASVATEVRSDDGGVRVARMLENGSAVIEVRSADGWACEGTYAAPAQNKATVAFPLACNDRMSAEAMMSVDRQTGRAALIFKRKDGDRGSAAFRME